jgi:hypothetical protein
MSATGALYGDRMHPDLELWEAWHPRTLAARLRGLPVPWYVAAGWAIDLFRGEQTRHHEDLEVALPAGSFGLVPPLFPEIDFFVPAGVERLTAMTPDALAGESHQTWAYERAAGRWRFDVFREPHDGDTWICRRDERIRLPYADIIRRTPDGIPYLTPEVVLLFKAKANREKDRADFAGALPLLTAAQRAWLDDALALVHPGHPWRSAMPGEQGGSADT